MAPGVSTRTSPGRQVTKCDASQLATTYGTALSGQTWMRPGGRESGDPRSCMIWGTMPEADHRVYPLLQVPLVQVLPPAPSVRSSRNASIDPTAASGISVCLTEHSSPIAKSPPNWGCCRAACAAISAAVAGGPRALRATPREGRAGFVSVCGPRLSRELRETHAADVHHSSRSAQRRLHRLRLVRCRSALRFGGCASRVAVAPHAAHGMHGGQIPRGRGV